MSPAKKKPATDWAGAFTRPESAPRSLEPVAPIDDAETPASEPEKKKPAPRGPRGPYNTVKVEKRTQTFRLPLDVFELIAAAQAEAAQAGNKLTNDEAVTQAVRWFYGKRRRR
jgi:hypothetical protein